MQTTLIPYEIQEAGQVITDPVTGDDVIKVFPGSTSTVVSKFSLPRNPSPGSGSSLQSVTIIYKVVSGVLTGVTSALTRYIYQNASGVVINPVTLGAMSPTPLLTSGNVSRNTAAITVPTFDNEASGQSVNYAVNFLFTSTAGASVSVSGIEISYNSGAPTIPVGSTYAVGTDFPTIQAALDYTNTGLKPVSTTTPPGSADVIINVPAGNYTESLYVDNGMGSGDLDYPGGLPNVKGRGVRLVGDTRPIANFTYMNGGLLKCNSSYSSGSGQNNLGAQNATVGLTNGGTNTITVGLSNIVSPLPNFGLCGVVAGDIIIVTDNNGAVQQRNVVSVSGNTVTHDGTPVTITGLGAALTFVGNVRVMAAMPDFMMYVTSGVIEVIGIFFQANPSFTGSAILGIYLEGYSHMYYQGLGIDAHNLVLQQNAISTHGYASIEGHLGGGAVFSHMSVIGGNVLIDTPSMLFNGFYYVMAKTAQAVTGCLVANRGCAVVVDALQVCGAGTISGVINNPGSAMQPTLFLAFSCSNGVLCNTGAASMNVSQYYSINNCTTAFNLINATFDAGISAAFHGLSPSINNCVNGIVANRDSQFSTSFAIAMTGTGTGTAIQLTNGSKLTTSANITYSGFLNAYAIDATSSLNSPANAGTDPSPSNVYTYQTSGVMNSAYLNQELDSSGAIAITMDPAAVIGSTSLYRGKTFRLYASTQHAHTLTLPGAFFYGTGAASGKTVATFNAVAVGEGLIFTVKSNTIVQVENALGVTWS